MMQQTYLPFTEQQLLSHFAEVRQNGKCIKNVKHLKYYKDSIKKYDKYLKNNSNRKGKPLKGMKEPCQIEKDERFWIAACMMTFFTAIAESKNLSSFLKVPMVIFHQLED